MYYAVRPESKNRSLMVFWYWEIYFQLP